MAGQSTWEVSFCSYPLQPVRTPVSPIRENRVSCGRARSMRAIWPVSAQVLVEELPIQTLLDDLLGKELGEGGRVMMAVHVEGLGHALLHVGAPQEIWSSRFSVESLPHGVIKILLVARGVGKRVVCQVVFVSRDGLPDKYGSEVKTPTTLLDQEFVGQINVGPQARQSATWICERERGSPNGSREGPTDRQAEETDLQCRSKIRIARAISAGRLAVVETLYFSEHAPARR